MYFDPHTNPDWWQRPQVLKAALDEIDGDRRARWKRWLKGLAALGFLLVITLAYFF